MNNGLNLIMPMGGAGTRFSENGFEAPKPLLEIFGKPFFWWATQSIAKNIALNSLVFVVLQEHIDRFAIDEKILAFYPDAKIVAIPHVLNGAVLTCIEGVKAVHNNSPVIFNDCDHMFRCKSLERFCAAGEFSSPDGALLTFKSHDPKFSFLELNNEGNVVKTVEKVAVSDKAICGAYYFKNKQLFQDAADNYLKTCSYKEYFVSGVYNALAQNGAIIKNYDVDVHVPFGTPEEYNQALMSREFEKLL